MIRIYKIPGKELGYEQDRVYKVVDRLPHRVTSGFAEYQSQENWSKAIDLLLIECVIEGPIPDGKGGWIQGKITDEYLQSNDCDGIEMNMLAEMIIEDSPALDPKKQNELKKKARKSSA